VGCVSWPVNLYGFSVNFVSSHCRSFPAVSGNLVVSGLFISLLFMVVYVPSLVTIVLAFFFTGLFIAALDGAGILKPVRFEYFKKSQNRFCLRAGGLYLLIGGTIPCVCQQRRNLSASSATMQKRR